MRASTSALSAEEARALVEAERARGFSGRRWHMRPAGEASPPARHLDPSDVKVRWPGDIIPGTERVVNVSLGSWSGAELEELGDDPMDGAPQRRRPGRPKGSGSKATKDQASRERGHEANRERARQRRETVTAALEPDANTEPTPEMPSVPAPVVIPVAAETHGYRAENGQLSLFGERFWVEACARLNQQSEEAAA